MSTGGPLEARTLMPQHAMAAAVTRQQELMLLHWFRWVLLKSRVNTPKD
jgi:hypothetical protein